jgi:hypothetical protein
MTHAHLFLFVFTVVFLLLFSIFIYNREVRKGVIMTDLREDFEQTKKALIACTPSDAETLIYQFEKKWADYVDPITLSNYTYELYKMIFKKHGNAALN